MDIRIFVFQHMQCQLPSCFADRKVYTPIQCGRAINAPIPEMLGDDTGDNISELNRRYNEMTAIYWIAHHYEELGDPEYIGFDHYRRYLNWTEDMLSPRTVIARRWFSWRRLRGQYANCHGTGELDLFSQRFKQIFPLEEYGDYDTYWETHFFYICNMFIMHRDNFRRYAKFILSCIDILRQLDGKDSSSISLLNYQSRIPSFILERMTSYWLWHEKRKNAIDIVPSTITHFNIENPLNGGQCQNRHAFLWFLRQAY